jgi:uncharacterized BrkB/YihY/UPF0761 family membrane protein
MRKPDFLPALRAAAGGTVEFVRRDGMVFSAAIAFNLLLSAIPVAFLAFAITSFFLGKDDLPFTQLSSILKETFPYGAPVLVQNLRRLVSSGRTFGVVGLLLLLVSSYSFTAAVHKSLAVVMGERRYRERGRTGRAALSHLVLVVSLTVLTSAAILVPPLWKGVLHLLRNAPPGVEAVIEFLSWLVSFAVLPFLLFAAGFASYKWLSPRPVRNPLAAAGSVMFLLLVLAARKGFLFYVSKLSRMSVIYGSLFGIVSFIIVAYLFAASYLLCAAVIAEADREGMTKEPDP